MKGRENQRDTLMSFSRDVPGAETIDKSRELEARDSRKKGLARASGLRKREERKREREEEKKGWKMEGGRNTKKPWPRPWRSISRSFKFK